MHEYHNLHSFIVADYFNSPEVLGYLVDKKDELPEAKIAVSVMDFMFAKSVSLTIQTPDGAVLDGGAAEMANDGQTWVWILADKTLLENGNHLVVEVTDHPGHVVSQTFVL